MFDSWRLRSQWRLKRVADALMTSGLVRWTWTGLGEPKFPATLSDFRPADIETVREMMAGRYLFAGKLIDTEGTSPFSLDIKHADWVNEMQSFAWLRHFRDASDDGTRQFARMLTLDWIARQSGFDGRNWALRLTARRVLNWLRHLPLLLDGAKAEQARTIKRMLARQIQSLRARVGLTVEPSEAAFAEIALLGTCLCDGSPAEVIDQRLRQVERLIGAQIDKDGLHLSRNPGLQVMLLADLTTVRQGLAARQFQGADRLGALIERMNGALAHLTMGSGELGYFNGGGQQQVDLVYALQARTSDSRELSRTLSGYGILHNDAAQVIADSGLVPPLEYAGFAHAGAMSFEFSHGSELIVGNCGPAPSELAADAVLFRLGAAQSAPVIEKASAASIIRNGAFAGRLIPLGGPPEMDLDPDECGLRIRSSAYRQRFGLDIERWLTLISGGESLVGQDRITPAGERPIAGLKATIRFHLGPGVRASRAEGEEIVRITLGSGSHWSFLWEGAHAHVEDSVRQSAFFGFYKTRQIVLETELTGESEIAWILTRLD